MVPAAATTEVMSAAPSEAAIAQEEIAAPTSTLRDASFLPAAEREISDAAPPSAGGKSAEPPHSAGEISMVLYFLQLSIDANCNSELFV